MKRNYFVFCLLALFGSLNMQAYDFEVDGIYYTVTDTASASAKVAVAVGEELYEGSVAIPATVNIDGKAYSVTAIGEKAFYYCKGLTSITIPESVKEIGSNAFRNCAGLSTLTLPAGVTSIGYSAFFGCSGLTSFTIPAGVTTIEPYTFFGCKRIPSINLNGITKIGGSAFASCVALDNVTLPEALTEIGSYLFQGCTGLKTISIPANVKNIGDAAFQDCTGLTSVTIPEGVVQIGRATFEDCTGLTALNLPSTVKSISYSTFWNCNNLASIAVADGNPVYDSRNNCNAIIETYTVDAKTGKQALKLIVGCKNTVIPDGVEEIGSYAFLKCTGLSTLDIPASVSSLGTAAFMGSGLTTINVPESITIIDEDCFAACENLASVTLSSKVTKIEDGAFASCPNLKAFYCNAEKCPTATADAFFDTPVETATLYVPNSSVGTYTLTAPWSLFGTISSEGNLVAPEKDSATAIAALQGAGKVQQVYNLSGQQSSRIQRGINVIRMNDGTTRKVLVK